MRKSVIVSAKRTPVGSFLGSLAALKVTELGSKAIKSILDETGIDINLIDEVIFGNVLSAGVGQAPARQAALYAGLPAKTECLTINKMCGSGLKAVMLADQAIRSGDADIIIAGGMESMSNAPFILQGARTGFKAGNQQFIDSMIHDGLWDVYDNIHMGNCAESCARDFNFSRDELDKLAVNSYQRANNAVTGGRFKDEITPVVISGRKGDITVTDDEEPSRVNYDKIPSLRPAFEKDGVVTAANASKLNDGAAALLIMSEDKARELNLTPIAEIIAQSSAAKKPVEFTTAPADAIKKVIEKADMSINDIDLFEINEAFAVVSLAVCRLLSIPEEKVNVNGGAIAIGHPIGASGARILTTLVHEMKKRDSEYGLATLCIGGGEASALIIKNYR